MKCAAEFRELARNALRGKWGTAVIVGLVAVLLGGIATQGARINVDIDGSSAGLNLSLAGQTVFSTREGLQPAMSTFLAGAVGYIILVALVMALLYLFLGSVVGVGYARFNQELVDQNNADFEHLFKYFPYWTNAVCTRILKAVYIFLWTLLLVVPGIMAEYSYAMTEYILAEHPEMTADRSHRGVQGNDGRKPYAAVLSPAELYRLGYHSACSR